jgi:phospho-N-acetylmuramoyl-pentapeptide-transferase
VGRALGAFFTAFLLGVSLLPPFLRLLRRCHVEQSFRAREEVRGLADLHALKAHTPTMGGVCIWLATVLATLAWGKLNSLTLSALFVFSAFGAIGLADDLYKFFRHSSKGLSGRKKLLLEAVILIALLAGLRRWDLGLYRALHELWIPLSVTPLFCHIPTILAFAFAFLVISGSGNAVNLTDGVDGLAAGCSITTCCALTAVCLSVDRGGSPAVSGAAELAVLLMSLAGALLAFLWYNCQPARIFMGDGGSLAIGGLLGSAAFLIRQPFLLAVLGGVFVLEALSVLAQVYYFRWTGGRRIFRMAPLHHHFELGGWPESLVVGRFWIASLLFCAAGLALHFLPRL